MTNASSTFSSTAMMTTSRNLAMALRFLNVKLGNEDGDVIIAYKMNGVDIPR